MIPMFSASDLTLLAVFSFALPDFDVAHQPDATYYLITPNASFQNLEWRL